MNINDRSSISVAVWGSQFYRSPQWISLRYKVIRLYGHKCCRCGNISDKFSTEVDHIKPRSKYPHLALDINNLQVLCKYCNTRKGVKTEDYRTATKKAKLVKLLVEDTKIPLDQQHSKSIRGKFKCIEALTLLMNNNNVNDFNIKLPILIETLLINISLVNIINGMLEFISTRYDHGPYSGHIKILKEYLKHNNGKA